MEADPSDPLKPCWNNVWIPTLDALSIYCLLAETKPKRYFEIGSGNSTKFAKAAVNQYHLATEMLSIDPCPRAEIDILCDRVHRQPVEEVDVALFNQLADGDMLFIDNSHRCFTNSDVTTVFLDIIPYLQPGVLIGIHDIFLPYDYPPEWNARFYSEQYLLASYLLAKGPSLEIVLPNQFIVQDHDLFHLLDPIWQEVSVLNHLAGIFWLRTM
jgi:hypothetical protein